MIDVEINNDKADKWTALGAGGELVTGFISNTYWLATLFDIATGMEANIAGISFYALGFGVVTSSIVTVGATYSHYLLNTAHQNIKNSHSLQDTKDIQEIQKNGKLNLTLRQKVALAGDYIAHIGERAGPLTFVANLATQKVDVPRWGKAVIQCSAAFFGATTAFADFRTCKNNMYEINKMNTLSETPNEESALRL